MSEPFTREERDRCLQRIREAEAVAYVPYDPARPRSPLIAARAEDAYHAVIAEYSDRLPRVLMSACPFTGLKVLRAWDPFGVDGPWWHATRTFTPAEPAAPPSFRDLLGALDLRGRESTEATLSVIAGPGVPFVVPQLLGLPDMVAVIHRIELATGAIAYPTGYFSREEIHPASLHQFWTRPDLWFKTESGSSWTAKNHRWDFELEPWIEKGKVRWIRPGDPEYRVAGFESGERCPYVGLEGVRMQQTLCRGQISVDDPPDGTIPEPFEANEPGDDEE